MNKDDFEHIVESIQGDTENFLEENDRVMVIVRDVKTGDIHFAGNDCVVCLVAFLEVGIKSGSIKHKGEMIGEEHT